MSTTTPQPSAHTTTGEARSFGHAMALNGTKAEELVALAQSSGYDLAAVESGWKAGRAQREQEQAAKALLRKAKTPATLLAFRRLTELGGQALEAIALGDALTARALAGDALRRALEAYNALQPVPVVPVERVALKGFVAAYDDLSSLAGVVECHCPEQPESVKTEADHRSRDDLAAEVRAALEA